MNILSKAIPLLNKYVPPALAIKGLSKIDNRLSSFIQDSLTAGYTTDAVIDFLRSSIQNPADKNEIRNLESMEASGNIHPEQQRSLQKRQGEEAIGKGISTVAGIAGGLAGLPQGNNQQDTTQPEMQEQLTQPPTPPSKEGRNIIQQYSPELHQFIEEQVKNGRNPIEAGAIAQNDKRFSSIINKLSKDHKTPWSNILQTVYGQGELQSLQPEQNQQQQLQQKPGQGQAALMAILEQIRKSRGGQ